MTTPDKEEMPTEDRTAGPTPIDNDVLDAMAHVAWEKLGMVGMEDVRKAIELMLNAAWFEGYQLHSDATIQNITRKHDEACNAYEPMREALILAEKADRIHSKCQECEDGAQAPEACGDCFPSADDARVARRNVLKSLGVRMRDVDRARAIEAEPSICNCSQEDVHDYGPCGEDCRSLVVSTLPVNERPHSGSDSYQADADAPALSEKVNARSEWLPIESAPHGPNLILAFRNDAGKWRRVIGWHAKQFEIEVDADDLHSGLEEGPAGEAIYAKPGWYEYLDADEAPCNRIWPTHWMPLPSPPGAELNIWNEAERDGVSLKPDTSSQPASEAGKLSEAQP